MHEILTPAPTPLDDADIVEELFFLEGIDGHAESVPSSEPDVSVALGPTRASPDDASLEAEEEENEEEALEDRARTRRRRAARIGVAWGAVVMLGFAAVAASLGHRTDARSVALSASPALPETATHAQISAPTVATPSAPAAAMALPQRPARATTASATSVGAATPRAAARKKASPSSHAKHPAPAPPRAASARTNRAHTPAAPHAASKPHRPAGPKSVTASPAR